MSASVSTPVGVSAAPGPAAGAPGVRIGSFARYCAWLLRSADARALREIEPHLARDVGVSPGAGRCPEGYAVDPRPLWGIGLTPRPMDVSPPWPRDRRGG